jgi:EmrB/QacA subfamily drug resistance transporter
VPATQERRAWYPWVVMGVVLSGSYLVVLNTTVLGVALPDIASDVGRESGLDVDWVITSYLLAVVGIQPATAWMADRLGHKRLYVSCLMVFAAGSLACAIAPNLPALLAARMLQGAGGGALMPLGMAMVLAVFPPHRRGLVLGIRGVAVMAGPALGPPIGGIIVTQSSWRLIFALLVPIAVVALVLAVRLLRDPGDRGVRPLDGLGWTLAFVGIALAVIAARQAPAWGYTSPITLTVLAVAVALLGWLGFRSVRREHPILELRLVAVPIFGLSLVMVWLITFVQFARLNFLPVELQVVRGASAQEVGLMLVPAAIGVALTMATGGWLADRIGARIPMVTGLSVLCYTTWQLATLQPDTSAAWIVTVLLIQGLGTGLMRIPLNVAGLNALHNRFITHAAALRSLNRQVAGALGTAVLAAILTAQIGVIAPDVTSTAEILAAQAAYNRLFLVAFWVCVVALVCSFFMPGRARMRQLQAWRAEEYDAEG